MFRRSRFSIRPNVGTAGRTAATPQEAPSVNQEASETPKDASESSAATAVTDNKSVVSPSEKPSASGDGNDQNGEGTSSSAAVQRRKRFSVKPKVAPGRPSTLARTPKSPVKAVSETHVEVSDLDKPTTSSQAETPASPPGLQSPRRRRTSEDSKQPKVQPKPTIVSSDISGPAAVPPAEDSLEQTHLPADSGKQLESTSGSQVKEVPPRLPDKVPPSLPDKEAIEISEKAKTLVSSKSGLSLSPPALCLSRLLNNPSDLQRIAKARKLRELLRHEMHKEKKIKKAKARAKEYDLDPAKMTMRDLIRYLPLSNPMTSSLEDRAPENETVVPPSPGREESPERAQEPEVASTVASPREEEEEEVAEEEQDDAIMVPQVKVAEDGSLIIDEESLTVEVQRAKGPNPAQDRDPIFERGSTTTYSSFRKGTYSKPWSSEETDMFFLAVSMVGTDFSMICQLFPHRARSEIKNKFKKEERQNAWRIDKAFRDRRKLDIEYFSKLLEKILEVQKNRKKLKSLADKNSPKKRKRKAKGKKAEKKLSDVEEEDEEEENEIPLLEEEEEEEEGEKENEDLCNEGGSPVSKPKKKRQRKSKQDASTEEPNVKKSKTGEKSSERDEAYIPEDAEAALPEDRTDPDMSEKTENVNAAKDPAIKPAKLSRGRAPKPLLPLGRKWGKKAPPPSTDKEDERANDGASDEQVNKDASPIRQANKRKSADDDISSEEEGVTIQPPRPTRYGRVPKPTNLLTYAAKDDAQSSASETTAASPAGSVASAAKPKPKSTAKRARSSKPQSAQESKKPKLVTLWASQSDYSDEENERQWEEEEEEEEEEQHPACSSSKDSIAPAFVPASLRSPPPVISEVEETMEELDILANMPDVLGISQDALCPDASCELAQNETGTAEPCEHQLDLLVDVIDFLSSDHTEVTEDDGYNEAAQTLLAIGNLAHLSQSAQNQTAIQDHTTETTSVSVEETEQPHVEVEIASSQEEDCATPLMYATHGQGVTETPEAVVTVELQNTTTDNGDVPIAETSDQRTGSDTDPTPQLQSCPERASKSSPQTRRGRLSKVKPKPNLGQASRTAHSKSQPETSAVKTSEDTDAPGLSQATETQETPKIANDSPKLSKDEISSIEVKLKEEPSGSQETSVDVVKSGAAAFDQSASENQSHCSSGTTFEPTLEQATRDSTKTSCHDLVTSVTAVTELQGTTVDSPPVQQSSDRPAPCVSPAGDLPVSQKEEGEATPSRQTRKSRFQKVKPKPNLAQTSRTVHSKPETMKDPLQKDPTPHPTLHENATVEVEAELTDCTFPEEPSQSTGPASDLIPSCDLGSNLRPTEELSTTEGKNINVEVVCQEESDAAASDRRVSEYQNFPEAQVEPSREQAFRDTRPASESTEEQLVSPVGTAESSCSNPLPSDSVVPESQAGQASNVDSPVRESSDQPAPCDTHAEESAVSQKEEREAASTSQTRKDHLERDKPISPKSSRTVQSKPQTTEDPITRMQLMEKPSSPTSQTDSTIADVEPTCSSTPPGKPSQVESPASAAAPSLELGSTHKPTEELSSAEGPKTDVGGAPDSSSEASEQNIPPRRRRFPKVKPKPNLGSSTRTPQAKLRSNDVSKPSEPLHVDTSSNVTSEQQSVDNIAERDDKQLTSTHYSLHTELLSSTKLRPAESETSQGASSDGIVTAASSAAENQTVLTDSVLDNKSSENPAEGESTGDRVEAGPASQWDCKQDLSIRATETNNQPTDDPTAISGDGSSELKVKSVLPMTTQSTPEPKDSTQQPRSENDSESSQDPVQQCSEASETSQAAAESTEDNETTDSSKSSRKAPLTRRGRLVKPKPNLGRSRDPPQPQKVQNIKQAEADSGTRSEGVDASASQQPVSEVQPDVQEPAEGASEQCSTQNPPPHVAGSSLSCEIQVPESCSQSQNASTSSTGGTQSHPGLTLFTDMLSVQVPSDPDEPFFILSLTEIPVCSSGEVVDSVSEPLSYLPVTDASAQQQSSVPGEGLGLAARDGPLSNAAPPGSTEESGDVNVKDIGPDTAAGVGSIMENPVDPHESSAVAPSILPETGEDNDETERPSTKQRLAGPGRTAKRQVKPKAPRTKQARKTPAAKDAEPIPTQDSQDSELPGQPKAFEAVPQTGSGDYIDSEKETRMGEAAQARRSGSRNRKPKDFPSFLSETNNTAPSSDASPGTASSEVKTPPAAGERSTPVASTSRDVAPTPGPAGPEETHPTASTAAEADVDQRSRLCSDQSPAASACTAEVAASQQIDSMDSSCMADEPTNVSQYFLSDIFTDVEEG